MVTRRRSLSSLATLVVRVHKDRVIVVGGGGWWLSACMSGCPLEDSNLVHHRVGGGPVLVQDLGVGRQRSPRRT